MKVTRYANAQAFRDDTWDILGADEVRANLILSIALRDDPPPEWLLATVKDEGGVRLIAVCTPPFNLLLHENGAPSDEALRALSDALGSAGYAVPGVNAARGLAGRFAHIHNGGRVCAQMAMNIMKLTELTPPRGVPGYARSLAESDLAFVPYWEQAFTVECGIETLPFDTHVARVRARLGQSSHYIWQDSCPVSQAVIGRRTPHGAVINGVYTPPHYRGRGYATACVAQACASALVRGFSHCVLFADAKNPLSNKIYGKIGFRDVDVFETLTFGAPAQAE